MKMYCDHVSYVKSETVAGISWMRQIEIERDERRDMQRRPSLEQKKGGGAGGGEML